MHIRARIGIHLIGLVITVCPAIGQVETGTAIFGLFTKRDIVISADSGFTAIGPHGSVLMHQDGACKIAALNEETVFAISGYLGTQGSRYSSLLDEARSASSGTKVSSIAELQDLARRWAERVRPLVDTAVEESPQLRHNTTGDNTLSSALFISKDLRGGIMISLARIRLNPYAQWKPFTSVQIKVVKYTNGPYSFHLAMAHAQDIWNELQAASTDRARANSSLVKRMNASATVADMEKTTMNLSKLAAQWEPNHVGDEIDQIHLGPHGIQWLHRSQSCAGN